MFTLESVCSRRLWACLLLALVTAPGGAAFAQQPLSTGTAEGTESATEGAAESDPAAPPAEGSELADGPALPPTEVLVPVVGGIAAAGVGVALALSGGGGGGDNGGGGGESSAWYRQSTLLNYDAQRAASFRGGGEHRSELMALSRTRTDGLVGFNPYLLVNAPTAYGYGATGEGQIIAVLDDGFQMDHPELAPKIAGAYQRSSMPVGLHGTHVASLAAGALNGEGMFGLAYGARLHLASSTDSVGSLDFSPTHWANAMRAAQEAGAVVHSNSWGIEGQGRELIRTVDVNRVVEDPTAVYRLGLDVREAVVDFLVENDIDLRDLQGNRNGVVTVFTTALALREDEPVQNWLPRDWRNYVRAIRDFQNDGVVVFALSNNADLTFADFSAALPEIYPGLRDAWIAVANVDFTFMDPGNQGDSALLARRMSAPCAQVAAYCLSHDGTQVLGAIPVDDYRPLTGTSMATPQVSGAVAILAQAFPDHTPAQLTQRLLATAHNFGDWDDLRVQADGSVVGQLGNRRVVLREGPGEVGVSTFGEGITHAHSSVYGHGFMDLAAAMNPVGEPRVAVGRNLQGARYSSFGNSRVSLGPAFGDGLAKGLANQSLMLFDSLGGGFSTPVDAMVGVNSRVTHAGDLLAGFAERPEVQTLNLAGGARLEMALHAAPRRSFTGTRSERVAVTPEVELTLPLTGGLGLAAWSNRPLERGFGLQAEGSIVPEQQLGRDAFASPFLGFVSQARGAALDIGAALGSPNGVGLRIAAFEGQHRDSAAYSQRDRERDRIRGTAAELRLPLGEGGSLGRISLTGGLLQESGTILGARTEGAFATEGGTPTAFTGISGRLSLDGLGLRGVSLVGSANWGWTQPRAKQSSLFSDFSTVATESYSLGLQGKALFDERDRFGLTLNQPLRVRSGSARLDLPVGRTSGLDLRHERVSAGLAPSGREVSLEASYGFRLDQSTDLAGAVMYRSQPGHRRSAASEGIGLLKLQVRF